MNKQKIIDKVLYNRDLRNKIVDYSGLNIKKRCKMCNEKIVYNNCLINVDETYKIYSNYETCEKDYICDENYDPSIEGDVNNIRCCKKEEDNDTPSYKSYNVSHHRSDSSFETLINAPGVDGSETMSKHIN